MSNAVAAVQAALISALEGHSALIPLITDIYDGPPPRAPFPYIAIGESPSVDWSTKTEIGREIRLGLSVWDDGESAARLHGIMAIVENAVAEMPRDLPGWRVASLVFVRSMVVRNAAGPWVGLVDHRVRVLATT
jgi:Protein of unknown function (DUF3168)